ncbi:hypothetical protein L208DRAFT_1374193 [Tricholoma matsutake]|nr:hypothetical protein L208DRAFT_1374193 [Tricholoma matsutake 945]
MPNLALLLKTRSISKISLNKVISPLHTQRFKAASTHAHQYLAYQFKTLQDVPTAHTYAAVKKVVVKHIKVEHPGQHNLTGLWIPYFGQFALYQLTIWEIPHDNMKDGLNSPITHAFLAQIAGNSSGVPPLSAPLLCMLVPALDLALQPLPSGTDDDLSDPPTIVKAQGHKPSTKIAGSHQKGKGKQNTTMTSPDGAH